MLACFSLGASVCHQQTVVLQTETKKTKTPSFLPETEASLRYVRQPKIAQQANPATERATLINTSHAKILRSVNERRPIGRSADLAEPSHWERAAQVESSATPWTTFLNAKRKTFRLLAQPSRSR